MKKKTGIRSQNGRPSATEIRPKKATQGLKKKQAARPYPCGSRCCPVSTEAKSEDVESTGGDPTLSCCPGVILGGALCRGIPVSLGP